jgi:hypothetical protein
MEERGTQTHPVPGQEAVQGHESCDRLHLDPIGYSSSPREAPQFHIEYQEKEKAQPEDGHGDAEDRVGPGQVVKKPVAVDGGDHPDEGPHYEGEDHAGRRELKSGRKVVKKLFRSRTAADQGGF